MTVDYFIPSSEASSHIRAKKQLTGCLIPYHFVRADEKNNTKNFNWLMNSSINEAIYFVRKVKYFLSHRKQADINI